MVTTPAAIRMKSVVRPGLSKPLPARYVQKPHVEFRRTSKRDSGSTVCHAFSTTDAAANVWQRYCYSLVTNPLQTKAATSLVGFILGDVLAQYLEGHGAIDPLRMGRLGLYGLLLDGPVGHLWYRWLDDTCDKTFSNPRGLRAVLTKTAADQLVWAPVMTCAFFAVLKMLEGHPELVLPTIQDKVIPTLVANYALWPLAHFISFKYVPGEQRILYNNVVSIAWNCYLSMSVGSPEFANMDPTLLPPLSELASRISQSLPAHHFWLTDALSSVGVEGGALSQGVQELIHIEQFLVWNGLSHSGAAEKMQSAAAMQFELDAAWHIMREVFKDPTFFC